MAGAKACRGARIATGAGRGGGEAAAVDVNCWGRDGNTANGEKIRSTAKEMEWARAPHDVNTLPAMAVAATKGRRKRRHRRLSSSSEEDEDKDLFNKLL